MTYDELYNAINKGIPNYLDIDLDINILLRECSSDKALLLNEIRKIRNNYETFLKREFGYAKAQFYFFDSLSIHTSYKDSESTLHINSNSFLEKLIKLLGVSSDIVNYNDLELKNKLLAKVDELKSIKDENELKLKFPFIYDDYELSKKAYLKIGNENNYIRKKELWNFYIMYGFDTRFDKFMVHQINMYRNFVVRRQFNEGYVNRNPLNLSEFKGLDKDKFELYVAYQYLDKARSSDDFDTVQECVKYLAAYIREYKSSNNKSIDITLNNSLKISFRNIFNGYIKLFKMYSELKPLDNERSYYKGYNHKHVINHVNKYYGHSVDWVIIPECNLDLYTKYDRASVVESLNKQFNYLSKSEREREINRRYQVYDRKIKFYNNDKLEFSLVGLRDFNGYTAYIYSNGTVILDKLFSDYASCKPAVDEALFVMDLDYFNNLSKFDKGELIKKDGVYRKYHCGKWEDRIIKFIERDNVIPEEKLKSLKLKYLKK